MRCDVEKSSASINRDEFGRRRRLQSHVKALLEDALEKEKEKEEEKEEEEEEEQEGEEREEDEEEV